MCRPVEDLGAFALLPAAVEQDVTVLTEDVRSLLRLLHVLGRRPTPYLQLLDAEEHRHLQHL